MFIYNLRWFNGYRMDDPMPIHDIEFTDNRRIIIDLENGNCRDCGKIVAWDLHVNEDVLRVTTTQDVFEIEVLSSERDTLEKLRDLENKVDHAYNYSSSTWWDSDEPWWIGIHISDFGRDEDKQFDLPSSSPDAKSVGMTFRNGVLIEDEA